VKSTTNCKKSIQERTRRGLHENENASWVIVMMENPKSLPEACPSREAKNRATRAARAKLVVVEVGLSLLVLPLCYYPV
jgi:diaminopimelate epimerase